MKYHFKIHPESDGGYWAECMELPGCITEGDSFNELYENMQDALNTYIDEPAGSTEVAAMPDGRIKPSKEIIEVPLDPLIALSFLIRSHRLKHGLTQKEMSQKMGFENIYSYQRLEEGKVNPTFKKLGKLREIFPELSIDLAFAS